MRQGKQIHQGYSFFWGVFLLLVMSAAISIHAEAPSIKELVLFKDTLKNDTIVPQSPKKGGTLVIRDRIPIPKQGATVGCYFTRYNSRSTGLHRSSKQNDCCRTQD